MRKFLTVLMTVLMIASVFTMIPVSAEADKNPTFDNSTVADLPDLLVTEVMTNSITSGGAGTDHFDYIELYNNGDSTISLDGLSILVQSDYNSHGDNTPWNESYQFYNRLNIVSGDIFAAPGLENVLSNEAGANFAKYPVTNPADLSLAPGQIAVIWVWNQECYSASSAVGHSLAASGLASVDGEMVEVPFAEFYNHYSTKGEPIPGDALVLAVCGYEYKSDMPSDQADSDPRNNLKGDPISLKNNQNYVYAIVDNSWNLDTDKAYVENPVSHVKSINEKIHCMFYVGYGNSSLTGIQRNVENTSIIFVPADRSPVIYNAEWQNGLADGGYLCVCNYEYDPADNDNKKFDEVAATWTCPRCGKGKTEFKDYLEIGYVRSFREVATFTYDEKPTPGSMPAYQWLYVDENSESIPESITGQTGWQDATLAYLLSVKIQKVADTEQREEDKVTIDQVDRDKLGNQNENLIVIKKSSAVKCAGCGAKTYASRLVSEYIIDNELKPEKVAEWSLDQMMSYIEEKEIGCKECGGKVFTPDASKGKDGGLPIWALILIIVGGVVVVGGGVAVVLIFVVFKKKPAAEADAEVAEEATPDETSNE